MAIFSLHHTAIGRATQKRPHTAAAHVAYIARERALSLFVASRMPEDPSAAAAHLKQMEDRDRANARVADKVMLALPRELTAAQRAELIRAFAEDVTKGRASWLAAFHDKGKDAANPHCHLVIRDRDPETGKRVIGMSEAGSTDMLRRKWEEHANRALELAGRTERVDRRTLEEQGIGRKPTIHEGPKSRAAHARGHRPTSRPVNVRNAAKARQRARQVDYRRFDAGRTRAEYNAELKLAAGAERESDYWAAIDADSQNREWDERGQGADARRHQNRRQTPELKVISGRELRQSPPRKETRPDRGGNTARNPGMERDDRLHDEDHRGNRGLSQKDDGPGRDRGPSRADRAMPARDPALKGTAVHRGDQTRNSRELPVGHGRLEGSAPHMSHDEIADLKNQLSELNYEKEGYEGKLAAVEAQIADQPKLVVGADERRAHAALLERRNALLSELNKIEREASRANAKIKRMIEQNRERAQENEKQRDKSKSKDISDDKDIDFDL